MNPYVPETLPLKSLDWKRFRRYIGPANAALARYDGILETVINPKVLLSPLTTQEAVMSSRIEGTQATLEQVLEYEASDQDIDSDHDIREILNYRSAMRTAVESLKNRSICLNLLKEIHSILLDSVRGRNKARGEFRREQNFIAKPGARIDQAIFMPPEWTSVMTHLSNLERYIHYDEDDRLVQLAVIHAQFELIHPFLDGNGRVGRILLPLFLFEKGLLSSPMFYLSAYLEAHREQYYDALGAISTAREWEAWIEFFLNAVIEQAKENTSKARAILELYESKKTKVRELTRSQYAVAAVDAIFDQPVFRTSDFIAKSQIPVPTGQRILRILTRAGVLEQVSPGRGRRPGLFIFEKLIAIAEGRNNE